LSLLKSLSGNGGVEFPKSSNFLSSAGFYQWEIGDCRGQRIQLRQRNTGGPINRE
jgi:hypothetical protein